MRTPTLAVALAVALAPPPTAAQTAERHSLPGDDVAVYNLAGVLRVEGAAGSDIVVEVMRAGGDGAKLRIETGPLRGRATLRVLYPDDRIVYPALGPHSTTTLDVADDGTFNDHESRRFAGRRRVQISGGGRGLQAWADLRVVVPAGKRVAVYHGVGEATVSNVDGDLKVDVASADVTANRTKGSLRIDTGSGAVRLTDATGDVSLDTGSGGVVFARVRGRQIDVDTGSGEVTGDRIEADALKVDTGSGDVQLTAVRSPDVHVDTGSGNVRVDLLGDVESLHVDTGSGNVTLNVPATFGATVDIDTGSGEIDFAGVTLRVRSIEKDHVVGEIGDGRGTMKVETGSGDVKLRRSGTPE
jgi:hypothetical protein